MLVNDSNFTTIWIKSDNQKVKIIDQRLLPNELSIVKLNTVSNFKVLRKNNHLIGGLVGTRNPKP